LGLPGQTYSGTTAERVDEEVERLLEQAHQQARRLLTENRETLERLAQALLQEEVLDRDQVVAIIGEALTRRGGAAGGENVAGRPAGVEH
jgi:cell division protease FtsH